MKFRPELCLPLLWLVLGLSGCPAATPLELAPRVDLQRFMGSWYVIACIPTRIEREAYEAVESYRLSSDGRVLTTFTFRAGSFDGPVQRYTPVGFIVPGSHGAVWGMRFVWPFKADYRVLYVDADYTQTIIGRKKRDYVWIMARTSQLSPSDYARLVSLVGKAGYDVTRLRRVPQRTGY